MPAKSKAQQRFMGMVHAKQKGELKDASPVIKKAAKSMKKKDAKDFASTKHKDLPETVDEKFVAESIDSFLNESEEGFIDALTNALLGKGLTYEEADFAIGDLRSGSITDWAREYDLNPGAVEPIADDVIKFAFRKE